jgi:hypothetical protein
MGHLSVAGRLNDGGMLREEGTYYKEAERVNKAAEERETEGAMVEKIMRGKET